MCSMAQILQHIAAWAGTAMCQSSCVDGVAEFSTVGQATQTCGQAAYAGGGAMRISRHSENIGLEVLQVR